MINNNDFWSVTVPIYIEFVKQVYNEFNGKINNFCKPDLYIDYNMKSKDYGTMEIGKCITIAVPLIVSDYMKRDAYKEAVNKDYFIKSVLLDTTLHELAHHDQKYNYDKYNKDDIYHNKVESGVINYVRLFIYDNLTYIQNKFQFIFDPSIIHYEYYYDGEFKQFVNYAEYCATILYWLWNYQNPISKIYKTFMDFDNVTIFVNNSPFKIKENKEFSQSIIMEFCDFIKNFFTMEVYSAMTESETEFSLDSKTDLIIKFNIIPYKRNLITTKIKV